MPKLNAKPSRSEPKASVTRGRGEQWVYSACLCFALTQEQQRQSQFRYVYSGYQLEYSRNLLFKRGRQLDEVYQGLIDRTRR